MTSQRLSAREAELIAELVRERLRHHPLLEPLSAAGTPAMFGYSPDAVWLSSGGHELVRLRWQEWWDARMDTREDRAIEVVSRLVAALKTVGALTSSADQ